MRKRRRFNIYHFLYELNFPKFKLELVAWFGCVVRLFNYKLRLPWTKLPVLYSFTQRSLGRIKYELHFHDRHRIDILILRVPVMCNYCTTVGTSQIQNSLSSRCPAPWRQFKLQCSAKLAVARGYSYTTYTLSNVKRCRWFE